MADIFNKLFGHDYLYCIADKRDVWVCKGGFKSWDEADMAYLENMNGRRSILLKVPNIYPRIVKEWNLSLQIKPIVQISSVDQQ